MGYLSFFFFFFPTFFGLFFSFFFHPSLVFLETILRVDGFPIVSVLGSCCHHLLICTYILPHSFAFVETISAEIHLMPPPAFTAVISVPPGQSSSSSDEVCTVLLQLHVHLLQIQGTPDSLPKRWSPRLGMLKLTPAGIEPENWQSIH